MPDVVALAMPGGPGFIRAIQETWERGDAIFCVDQRLPASEQARVMDAIAPAAVIEADGERRSLVGGRPTEPGDAAIVATSGTTGHPKGVVHTHATLEASALATHKALSVDPDRDRWLACLPLAHIGGLAVVTRSLITGTPVEVHDRFDADAVPAALDRGVTLTSLVTRALVQVPTDRFRMILIGGAAPPPDRPANVWATYGLTETGSGCIYEQTPLDGVEIRIDADDEIWLRGPMLLRAYRNAATSPIDVDPKTSDGWFSTGDLGGLDNTGRLFVDGRKGDVIATGGEKVWPERTERVLEGVAGVAEAAAVGRPHPEWGHQVVAVVVADASAPKPSLESLREAVRAELPVWYAPTALEFVSTLPRTALGKLQRKRL